MTELLMPLRRIDFMFQMLELFKEGEYLALMIIVLSRCFVVFCCLPIHELAHALIATKCGDDTARLKGRLTINPFAHLDIIGTIMIFLFGIGYANPVPVNPARLKHPRRDMALVALAGPVSNLLMAFVSVFIYYIILATGSSNVGIIAVAWFFWYAASVNCTLAVFNFLPIPPLDGAKIFSAILPDKIYFKIMQYDRYIMIGLMVLLFTGVLSTPIAWLTDLILNLISIIPNLIFG